MYLGIDIGGTKTLLAVFDSKGNIKQQIKFSTAKNYKDFLRDLADNVDNLSTKNFRACGVAAPGRIDRENGIGLVFGNLPWKNVLLQEDIEKITSCPVMLEHDASLGGLYEARQLPKSYKNVLYVTIGTGIGTGLIINGMINPEYADSEGGHIMVEHHGKYKRWEQLASGKAMVKEYGHLAAEIIDARVWAAIAKKIGIGLIDLIAVVQPDIVIVGGGVGAHFEKYKDSLLKFLKRYEIPLVPIPPIKRATKPEEAVIYGCYELVREKYA